MATTAPLLRRRNVLASKIETTVGTAIAVAAADATINVYDAIIQNTIEHLRRPGQGGTLSGVEGDVGGHTGQCTFTIPCDIAGGVPTWADRFLPACGLVKSVATFTPESLPPEAGAANTKTLTLALYVDGKKYQLYGCMGNVVFVFTPGQPVMAEFTFLGSWTDPTDATILAPTYIARTPVRFVSSSLAIGSWNPAVSQMRLDMGNELYLRPSGGAASGFHSAVISGRNPTLTIDPEAALIAGYDVWGALLDRTQAAISWTVADGANNIAFSLPVAEVASVQSGDRSGIETTDITYNCLRSADAGDDEVSLVFT